MRAAPVPDKTAMPERQVCSQRSLLSCLRDCCEATLVLASRLEGLQHKSRLRTQRYVAGGEPGPAFSLVYGKVTDKVWNTLYSIDGVLAEWIRCPPPQYYFLTRPALQMSCKGCRLPMNVPPV